MYLMELIEARDKSIAYTDKKAKGVINKVIATLEKQKATGFTKIGLRYKKIYNIERMVTAEKEKLNADLVQKVDELFDAEDKVLTRVVETAMMTITISKATEDSTKEVTEFDEKAYIKKLETLLDLQEAELLAIKNEFTNVTTKTVKGRKARLSNPKIKPLKENAFGDFIKSIKNSISKYLKGFSNRLFNIDDKLDSLKAQMKKDGLLA